MSLASLNAAASAFFDQIWILSWRRRIIQYPDVCSFCVCVLPLKAADGFASVVNCRIESQAEAETLRASEKTKKSNDNSYTCECYNRIFGKLIWFSFSMLRFMQWTSECNAVCICTGLYIGKGIGLKSICRKYAKGKSLLFLFTF